LLLSGARRDRVGSDTTFMEDSSSGGSHRVVRDSVAEFRHGVAIYGESSHPDGP
jgi:hypothetical protein